MHACVCRQANGQRRLSGAAAMAVAAAQKRAASAAGAADPSAGTSGETAAPPLGATLAAAYISGAAAHTVRLCEGLGGLPKQAMVTNQNKRDAYGEDSKIEDRPAGCKSAYRGQPRPALICV